ncbi:MAG: hypothetical protein WB947_03630 [Thermoplasmata archaeon]
MPRRRIPRAEDALARTVLEKYLGLRRGETVTIETWSHALPWARSFIVEARRLGVRPTLIVEDESAFFRSLELLGSAAVSGASGFLAGGTDAHVYFGGPEEFPRLLGLPANDLETLVEANDRARAPFTRRVRTRGIRLAIGDVTPTAAARYGVDVAAWQTELLRASLVDPARLEATGHRLARRLARARRLRIRHRNGTDLSLGLATRSPAVISGRQDRRARAAWDRVPSGIAIFPIRTGTAEGTWETNRAAYDRFALPNTVVGGRFEFRAGRLTDFEFDRGGEPFAAAYARAGRGRERPVALTIGLNPAISHAPEVLELGLGTLGLLLGDAPPGSRGPRSGFSFLATLAGADVEVDGRPWLVGGVPPGIRS